jgi:hypothetical protein
MIGFGIKKSFLNFVLTRLSDLKDVFQISLSCRWEHIVTTVLRCIFLRGNMKLKFKLFNSN